MKPNYPLPFIKNNKVAGLYLDKKYLLQNIDELDFEFKDKTLNSTIKMLKDPEDDHYKVCSIVRFTE